MATLAEAYTQMLIAQADPMNSVVRTMAQQQLATSEKQLISLDIDLDKSKVKFVEELSSKLKAAQDAGADQDVIDTYRSLLSKYRGA